MKNGNEKLVETALSKGFVVNRRNFLKASATFAAGLALSPISKVMGAYNSVVMRFGYVTDVHWSTMIQLNNSRIWRDSLKKLDEFIDLANELKVDFIIEGGDFKDMDASADETATLGFLEDVEEVFQEFTGPTYHVLGNHDMDCISKSQFMARVTNTGISSSDTYYSFDSNGIHIVVLDANFKTDGTAYYKGNYDWKSANIPQSQLNWLSSDLSSTDKPALVFSHQLLDGSHADYTIKNASAVRTILEDSNKVLAVFNGHRHVGAYSLINDIHYYTTRGMIVGFAPFGSAYNIVDVYADGTVGVTGYRTASTSSRTMSPA